MRKLRWSSGLGVAALVVIVLAPLASPEPDGLERVAIDGGFIDRAQAVLFTILPGYILPGVGDGTIATILAGLIGSVIVFALTWGLGMLLARRRRAGDEQAS